MVFRYFLEKYSALESEMMNINNSQKVEKLKYIIICIKHMEFQKLKLYFISSLDVFPY